MMTFLWTMTLMALCLLTWHGYMFYRDVRDFMIEVNAKVDRLLESFDSVK